LHGGLVYPRNSIFGVGGYEKDIGLAEEDVRASCGCLSSNLEKITLPFGHEADAGLLGRDVKRELKWDCFRK